MATIIACIILLVPLLLIELAKGKRGRRRGWGRAVPMSRIIRTAARYAASSGRKKIMKTAKPEWGVAHLLPDYGSACRSCRYCPTLHKG